MNDGRGFLDSKQEALRARMFDPAKRTRIVFLHPASELLRLPAFLSKVDKDQRAQVSDIARGYRALRDGASATAPVQIRGSHSIFPCTYVISETYAFQSPYLCTKSGELPILRFAPEGKETVLYTRLRQDAENVFSQAVELKDSDFAIA